MPKQYYEKNAAGEFVEVGYEFTGFPSNGTWLVVDGKQNCIIPIEGIPEIPSPSLVSYIQYQDELQSHISKQWADRTLSVLDISKIACEFFAVKAGGMIVKDEIIES